VPISNERIVWIDCEMTGLDIKNDALIEVAALVTDSELNILGDGVDVVIKPDDAAVAQMSDFVRDMHTKSGLLAELPHGKTMAEAEAAVMEYISAWVPDPRKAPLGGNSVGTDRVFLSRDMPAVVEHLHYRVSCRAAGTPGPTSSRRQKRAATARLGTLRIPSTNCGTTAKRSSCPRPDRTVPRPRRSPRESSTETPPGSPRSNLRHVLMIFAPNRRKWTKHPFRAGKLFELRFRGAAKAEIP